MILVTLGTQDKVFPRILDDIQKLIDKKIFYPDFTIRHPLTRKTYYWEHFGMMDVSSYATHTYVKLQKYTENGIIPGINLITTYETKDNPLNPELVETLVKHYFT